VSTHVPVLPRVEVAAFAQAMEHQLRAHDDRPGWKRDDPAELYFHLLEEVIELGYALGLPTHLLSSGFFARLRLCDGQGPGTIGAEAADVGNMAMMIADVSDALEGGDATRRG
jgi:NTP pyrophosphatase (non-canonical NTP hydrolase)